MFLIGAGLVSGAGAESRLATNQPYVTCLGGTFYARAIPDEEKGTKGKTTTSSLVAAMLGNDRIYAVGDCVNFVGPKMGHMAIRQAEVAATNLAAEIEGREPLAHYSHEMRFVIDEVGGNNGLYVHKDISGDEPATVKQGQFWSWAKRAQQTCWENKHS